MEHTDINESTFNVEKSPNEEIIDEVFINFFQNIKNNKEIS